MTKMIRKFFLKTLNQYASKWLVLFVDVILVQVSFFIAYFVRFNISLDFDFDILLNQLQNLAFQLFL